MGYEEKKLRKEKVRVREMRKFTEMRKSSSDRLLAEHLTGFKVCAQKLLDVKVKRQIGSSGYLYPQLKQPHGFSHP